MTPFGRRWVARTGALLAAAVLAGACRTTRFSGADDGRGGAGRMPRDAARFEISRLTDTTAEFRTLEARWVRPGLPVHAVDPARADALVARLVVTSHADGRATARVTGQVARLAESHVLLLVQPRTPWPKQRAFWSGVAFGALFGVVASAVAQ
jgi:hypothetical protein